MTSFYNVRRTYSSICGKHIFSNHVRGDMDSFFFYELTLRLRRRERAIIQVVVSARPFRRQLQGTLRQ